MTGSVCLEFDGVIRRGDQPIDLNEQLIEGDPFDGVSEFIHWARTKGFNVVVFTARASTGAGLSAVRRWLERKCITVDEVAVDQVSAHLTVDDDDDFWCHKDNPRAFFEYAQGLLMNIDGIERRQA